MVFESIEDQVVDYAKKSLERPEDFGWWGREDMFVDWGFAGIDMHNASDLLQESNFKFVSKDLMGRFPDDFEIVGLRHWAVGHLDRLIVRVLKNPAKPIEFENITEAFAAAVEWHNSLQDYPVADEDHFSEMIYMNAIGDIKMNLPDFVLIKEDLDQTADFILTEILHHPSKYGEIDLDDMALSNYGFHEDYLTEVAYDLGLVDRNKQEEWDEAIAKLNLPEINWDFVMIPNHIPMEGQEKLSL